MIVKHFVASLPIKNYRKKYYLTKLWIFSCLQKLFFGYLLKAKLLFLELGSAAWFHSYLVRFFNKN
jgi:hypothetical protein